MDKQYSFHIFWDFLTIKSRTEIVGNILGILLFHSAKGYSISVTILEFENCKISGGGNRVRFGKLNSYIFGLFLIVMFSGSIFSQTQKKIDTIYGPMNYGLDRQDAWEANEIRLHYEINRIFREKEAKVIAISKQMKNCRTSECRAPLHQKVREIERKMQMDLAALAADNDKRIEWINKYWDIEEKKPQRKRIYFP